MKRHTRADRNKELEESSYLLRAWKKFHREEREAVVAGPHGAVLAELFRMFENLKRVQPVQLIGFVRSIDWSTIDYQTKLTVVHEINEAITAYREKRGLDPIDDGLPGELDTPYRTIKQILFPLPLIVRAPTGAQPGPEYS